MENLKERAGRVNIRVGGNTQDSATLVDSLPDDKMIEKDTSSVRIRSHRTVYFYSSLGYLVSRNTSFSLYPGGYVHDVQHIRSCERGVVSW